MTVTSYRVRYGLTPMMLLPLLACGGNNHGDDECGENASCAPESPLVGSVWELRRYTALSGQLTMVSDLTKYQISLQSGSNQLQVSIGCVNYADSTYEIRDGYLSLEFGSRDGVVCITETMEFADQHAAINDLLRGGEAGSSLPLMFETGFNELKLQASDGRVLVFETVPELMRQQ